VHAQQQHATRKHHLIIDAHRVHRAAHVLREVMAGAGVDLLKIVQLVRNATADGLERGAGGDI
jgi:hypothetical protein